MELHFFGAAGETTGSAHLLRFGRHQVLLDCGLFQGRRAESHAKNARFPFDARAVDAVVQSHAHVDHSGRLPMLVRQGFRGRIHATRATVDLCEVLLRDCAHILLKDAEHLNLERTRRRLASTRRRPRPPRRKGRGRRAAEAETDDADAASAELRLRLAHAELPAREVLPLYLDEDVTDTLRLFTGHEYGEWFETAPGMRFRFRDAGHILGSAWVEAELGEGGARERLVFTGDYGRHHQPILRDPEPLAEADVYVTESTYGDRDHPPFESTDRELAAAVRRLAERGRGRLLVPAFAVGRTQNVLYSLARLYRSGAAPPVDIVVDSPLATRATGVVMRHPECFDREALEEFRRQQQDPAFRSRLRFTESVEESKALNDDPRPLIVISASGMMETGRILHHLAHHVERTETEVLIVGFQAEHTLGRRLVEGAPRVRVYGVERTVRARVTVLPGFSAHAGREDLLAALSPHAGRARAMFLVHGEDAQRRPLAEELRARGCRRVELPAHGSRHVADGRG